VKTSRVPALLAVAATVILAAITALVGLEAFLLATGQAPITWYTECGVAAHPLWSYFVVALFAGGISALLAHFFWSHGESR
jgi:O-antigen ligase